MSADTCAKCDQPGDHLSMTWHRTLGTRTYCDECAEAILAPIRQRVAERLTDESGAGVGVGDRPRPDHGAGFLELECNVCGAGWVGRRHDPCAYCEHRHVGTVDGQRRLLLDPQLPGGDLWSKAFTVWTERLANGINAGIITRAEGVAAFQRQQRRAA